MSPALVEIYESAFCPYCVMAKRLLDGKGVAYTRYNVGHDHALFQEMVERSSRRSVPQIFIGGVPIGGYDDIAALNQRGELDPLLFPAGD